MGAASLEAKEFAAIVDSLKVNICDKLFIFFEFFFCFFWFNGIKYRHYAVVQIVTSSRPTVLKASHKKLYTIFFSNNIAVVSLHDGAHLGRSVKPRLITGSANV